MDLELAGKSVLVTGGSRGIGRAIAETLLEEGAQVVLAARTEEELMSTRDDLSGRGRRVHAYVCDTTNSESADRLVDFTVTRTGSLHVLVNAAAVPGTPAPDLDALSHDARDYSEFLESKLLGYLYCAQAAARVMIRNQWGRIINIGGMAYRTSGSVLGSARNAGVAAMTKNLADALAGKGIGVVAIHPGLTETERVAKLIRKRATNEGRTPKEIRASLEARTLLGRLQTPRDIANVVAFVSSPLSIAINGDSIPAMGGLPNCIYY